MFGKSDLFKYRWFIGIVVWFIFRGRFGDIQIEKVTFFLGFLVLALEAGQAQIMKEKEKSPRILTPYHSDTHRGELLYHGDFVFLIVGGFRGDYMSLRGTKAFIFPKDHLVKVGFNYYTQTRLNLVEYKLAPTWARLTLEEHKIKTECVWFGDTKLQDEIQDPELLIKSLKTISQFSLENKYHDVLKNTIKADNSLDNNAEEKFKRFNSNGLLQTMLDSVRRKGNDEEK